MANQKQESDHYYTRSNGPEWIKLERRYHGEPGAIRIDEIDEIINLLRKVQGLPEFDAEALRNPGARTAIVMGAHAGRTEDR